MNEAAMSDEERVYGRSNDAYGTRDPFAFIWLIRCVDYLVYSTLVLDAVRRVKAPGAEHTHDTRTLASGVSIF